MKFNTIELEQLVKAEKNEPQQVNLTIIKGIIIIKEIISEKLNDVSKSHIRRR